MKHNDQADPPEGSVSGGLLWRGGAKKMGKKLIIITRFPLLLVFGPFEFVAAVIAVVLTCILAIAELLPDRCWYFGGKYHLED